MIKDVLAKVLHLPATCKIAIVVNLLRKPAISSNTKQKGLSLHKIHKRLKRLYCFQICRTNILFVRTKNKYSVTPKCKM